MSTERDTEICRLYSTGLSPANIGLAIGLGRERVRQILKKAGVYQPRAQTKKSDREQFLGVNLSEADKVALRAEAGRRGISMSTLTSDLIREMLAR